MKKSSTRYSLLVRAHNLQIFRTEQGSKPMIDRSFLLCFSCCYREHKALYTELFSFSPHLDQFLRLLDLICVSVTIVRRHDVTPPSFSAIVLTTLRPHKLTIVELCVAYSRYPAGSTDRYSPAAVIKGNPYPEPPMRKLHFRPSSTSPPLLSFLQLALATLPLEHLSHLFRSLPSKLFFRLRPRRQGEPQSRLEEELKPSCHP
jgi:hypothetical protein